MAKRTRGSNRPGRRHENRLVRPAQQPAPRTNMGLSDEEEARAAELEEQFVAREKASQASRATAARPRQNEFSAPGRPKGLLAQRAAEEYGYVARDVRRIIRVAALMAGFLIVAWVLVDGLHLVKVG